MMHTCRSICMCRENFGGELPSHVVTKLHARPAQLSPAPTCTFSSDFSWQLVAKMTQPVRFCGIMKCHFEMAAAATAATAAAAAATATATCPAQLPVSSFSSLLLLLLFVYCLWLSLFCRCFCCHCCRGALGRLKCISELHLL